MTSQIILYKTQTGEVKIDVRLEDDTVWLTQTQIAVLFGKAVSTINEHIKNIYLEKELLEQQTMHKFGNSEFQQKAPSYYNLEMIIAIGYRVKSPQGTQFRIWATKQLKDYITKGFVLDDERFKTGNSMNYFDELQEKIREIRISERFFYQKIKDIYTTSVDYNSKSDKTTRFFKVVQNKLLWAISQQTAAELIYNRVDISKPLLGLSSIDKTAIKKSDISIAKNYLNENEMKLLGLLVEQYLAFAQTMAQQQTPMTMDDWIKRLDVIVRLNGKDLLNNAGKISHQMALDKAQEVYQQHQSERKQQKKQQSLAELEADIKHLK
jgi:hypothetical protein